MPVLAVTHDELDVLLVIDQWFRIRGEAPTMEEIGNEIGISKGTARRRVMALTQCGCLTAQRYRHRSVTLTAAGERAIQAAG